MPDHLTHRGLAGLAHHPVAAAQLPTGRVGRPQRKCDVRMNRGGSIGACDTPLHPDGTCPRANAHREEHRPITIGTRDDDGNRTFAPPGEVCAGCSTSGRWVPVSECSTALAQWEDDGQR